MAGLTLGELIAIVLPLAAIELGLLVWALLDLSRRKQVRGGSRLVWLLVVVVFFSMLGPILYLAWGRNE